MNTNSIILTTLVTLVLITNVNAIVNGITDSTNKFPFVGSVASAGFDGSVLGGCSGSLIHPRLFLGAGHCQLLNDIVWDQRTAVTFDLSYATPVNGSIFPGDAGSPFQHTGTGIVFPLMWDSLNPSCVFNSAGIGYWQCSPHGSNRNDVAIVVLDSPITDIDPANLATVGYLESLTPQQRKALIATIVGYGVTALSNNGVNTPIENTDGTRRYTEISYKSKTDVYAHFSYAGSNNEEDGGSCSGDSGGPVLIGGINSAAADPTVLSVVHGGDYFCHAQDRTYRVDTEIIQTCFAGLVLSAVNANTPIGSCWEYWASNSLQDCPFYQQVQNCIASL